MKAKDYKGIEDYKAERQRGEKKNVERHDYLPCKGLW